MDADVASVMVKRVLMIAYHYPPVRVSSGIQRTLKFSQYLLEFGWQPSVLTIHPRAYERISADQMAEIPAGITVKRAFALDSARHLAIRGAYPEWLALPDRWISWWPAAVLAGLRLIRRERPNLLWSTYPIATAHLIGLTLHRLTDIPWVADFRDSMTDPDYPPPGRRRWAYLQIEQATVRHCACAVFTAPGTLRMYAERHPAIPASRWVVIANGYDEENFRQVEQGMVAPRGQRPLTLVHSGVLYPSERDPNAFFGALADLKHAGRVSAAQLQIVLRATGHDDYHRHLIETYGIQDLVVLAPLLPYQAALQEMMEADGLLLFQAANCNHQIPAKVYEYLRARRPILALTDPTGDTGRLLIESGVDTVVPLDKRLEIVSRLDDFLRQLQNGKPSMPKESAVIAYSRYVQTEQLATLFEKVLA